MSAVDSAMGYVAELRARLERARARGQVELHLDLGTVDLLVTVAELVRDARQARVADAEQTAAQHAAGDRACGREWSCACAACRTARGAGWVPRG